MKDPAFLFYSSDFLTGTYFLNDEQRDFLGKMDRMYKTKAMHHPYSELVKNILSDDCYADNILMVGGTSEQDKLQHLRKLYIEFLKVKEILNCIHEIK